jgi:hypothetical protein
MDDDLQRLWQEQPVEYQPMPLDEIRRRAAKFERRIDNRNRREFAAGALVIAAFSFYTYWFTNPMVRAGSVLVVIGTVYVMWHLYRSGLARPLSTEFGRIASLDFYREELARQRDLVASVWKWYLAPPLPGLLLVISGASRTRKGAAIQIAATLVFFVFVWWLNHRGVRKLSRKIEELDQS